MIFSKAGSEKTQFLKDDYLQKLESEPERFAEGDEPTWVIMKKNWRKWKKSLIELRDENNPTNSFPKKHLFSFISINNCFIECFK